MKPGYSLWDKPQKKQQMHTDHAGIKAKKPLLPNCRHRDEKPFAFRD